MRKGDESKISFPNPRGLRASPQTYSERGGETYYLFVSNIIQYETSFFLLKYTLRFFIFKFDLNVKYRPYCLLKKLFIEKTIFFSVDYAKINELHEIQNIGRSIPLSK